MADNRTINLTITWEGIMPGLIEIIRHGETVEAVKMAESELLRLARIADKYVAINAKANY